ncbi:kinase-like domain-containing protein [Tanacetum coccineum]
MYLRDKEREYHDKTKLKFPSLIRSRLSTREPFVNGEEITTVDLSLAPKLYHLVHACKLTVPQDLPYVQRYTQWEIQDSFLCEFPILFLACFEIIYYFPDDMVAHVGDFGLARLLGTDLNQNSSSGVKGTIGYAPPEYGIGSEMTSSGDVYSFGILLLEVMTGKKPTDGMFNEGLSLHKFAYMALPDHVIDVIDNDAIVLQSTEANAKKVEECLIATIKIGVSCSLDSPPQRMKIEIVVIELQRIHDVLQNI